MKKGFTLVELLAIVVLLGAAVVILFPTILSNFEKKEQEVDQATLDILYSSADEYILKHGYDQAIGQHYSIEVSKMVEEGLVPVDVKKYEDKCIDVIMGKINNSYQLKACSN